MRRGLGGWFVPLAMLRFALTDRQMDGIGGRRVHRGSIASLYANAVLWERTEEVGDDTHRHVATVFFFYCCRFLVGFSFHPSLQSQNMTG